MTNDIIKPQIDGNFDSTKVFSGHTRDDIILIRESIVSMRVADLRELKIERTSKETSISIFMKR